MNRVGCEQLAELASSRVDSPYSWRISTSTKVIPPPRCSPCCLAARAASLALPLYCSGCHDSVVSNLTVT